MPRSDLTSDFGGYRLACWYASRGERSILWLEHLTGAGMTVLAGAVGTGPIPDPVAIIATTAETDWPDTLPAPARSLWDGSRQLRVGALSEAEETSLRGEPRLVAVLPALEAGDRLLGRLLVARGPARAALTDYGNRGAQVALLRLCIDWARLQIGEPLSPEHVTGLYPAYWRSAHRVDVATPVPTGDLRRAQAELTSRTTGPPGVAWLVDTGDGLRPHPLLVDIAEKEGKPVAWVTPDGVWAYLAGVLPHDELHRLGEAKLDQGLARIAATLLDPVTTLTPETTLRVADKLRDTGEPELARTWYTRTIGTGHPDQAPHAWLGLGVLEAELGEYDAARDAWRHAIDSGHPDYAPKAWANLGNLEAQQGEHDAARAAFGQAITSSHPEVAPGAWVNLGVLEAEHGEHEAARAAYREAIGSGHRDHAPHAWVNLGVLEAEQGEHDAARAAWRAAIDSGHADQGPRAWANLGALEAEQGKQKAARAAFGQAITSSHPDYAPRAWVDLGILEAEQGEHDAARAAYRAAIGSDHPYYAPAAWVELGNLEAELGDHQAARAAYRAAIASDHPDACAAGGGPSRQPRAGAWQP